ncbi:hypothetical protein [Magnetofaba australis]|uniref:Uncharacterized protein n=1 Tax=Magnetofaba australis IT-1 TaxID=1434232 RepID=A0A1Y2K7K2_9PROT|nr:hypothetical protein [Magnetofaba australis]OSM06733.1 hypothetical protein MAIT1_04732 [Magnetofaba australis IT-1]
MSQAEKFDLNAFRKPQAGALQSVAATPEPKAKSTAAKKDVAERQSERLELRLTPSEMAALTKGLPRGMPIATHVRYLMQDAGMLGE